MSSKAGRSGFAIGLVCAALAGTALGSNARADEPRADGRRAAVVPTEGLLLEDQRKDATSEIRGQLRYYNYALSGQQDVRLAAADLSPDTLPTDAQVTRIGRSLGVQLLLVPKVARDSAGGLEFRLVGYDLDKGTHVGFRALLPIATEAGLTREQQRPAVAACVAAVLGQPPDPSIVPIPTAFPFDLTTTAVGLATPTPLAPSAGQPLAPKPVTQPPAPKEPQGKPTAKDRWAKWDHTGVFIEGGFVLAWCYGDALCFDAGKGMGGRVRAGYRIYSMFALSISSVVAAHEIPTSVEQAAFAKRTFLWGGAYGGLRFHPVRRFILDPFIGIDLGWQWMYHISQREPEDTATTTIPGTTVDPTQIANATGLNNERTQLSLSGFAAVPQAGLRIFLAPSFAIGVVVEWHLPVWNKICATVTKPVAPETEPGATALTMPSGQKVCSDPSKIEKLGLNEALATSMSNKDALPKFMAAEFDLVFVF